jgi:hypothetical protein
MKSTSDFIDIYIGIIMISRYEPKQPSAPVAPASSSGSAKIMRISIPQLRELPYSDIKIGLMPLKEWNSRFIDYFHMHRAMSIEVRQYFNNIKELLTAPYLYTGPIPDQMRGPLSVQIMTRFTMEMAKISGDPTMEYWSYIFLSLKTLSFYAIGDQADPALLAEKTQKANQEMQKVTTALKLPYLVVAE